MKPKHHIFLAIFLANFFCTKNSLAVTLTASDSNYSTSSNITTDNSGIISSSSGSLSSPRKITNNHIITTGNNGANSGAYGINVSGDYYEITNSSNAQIITTGSSGRGISVSDFSTVNNYGSITTQGTTSYGIYLNGDGNIGNNFGTITTAFGYGIYLNGNANQFTNSGAITTTTGASAHGIYISAGTSSNANVNYFTTVVNSGTISSNSHAIYNKDNYSNVTNSGSLLVANSSSIYGVMNEGDNVVINNSGNISANHYAIYNSGDNVLINNSGNLIGGVRLNSGVLNILGGSISGEINGDSKQGSVVIGSDVSFNQEATFKQLAKLTLNSNSTLNSSMLIESDLIEIGNGATLNLNDGFAISNSVIQGLNSQYGDLNINSNFDAAKSNVALGKTTQELQNITISSSATVNISQNIYAKNLNIFGTLNIDKNDLLISGNLTATNNSAINIGAENHQIAQDFFLNEGSKLQISFTENGEGIGNFEVLGNAAISDLSRLEITTNSQQSNILNGKKFKIISTSNITNISQISNENISLNNSNSNIAGLLEYSSIVEAGGLYLKIDRLDKSLVTKNENLQNIYQNLNDLSANSVGNLLEFQKYLDSGAVNLSTANFALSQLRPNSTKMALQASYSTLDNSLKLVEKRLDSTQEVNLWIRPLGFSAKQNAVKNDDAFAIQTMGAIIGADKELSDGLTFGGFAGYLRSNTKLENHLQNNFVSSFLGGTYLRKDFSDFFFENISGFALNQFDTKRDIAALNLRAISQYWGKSAMTRFVIGQEKNLQFCFKIIPQISSNFGYNSIDAYEEKGAEELNLKVKKITSNYGDIRIGVALNWQGKIPEAVELEKIAATIRFSYGKLLFANKPTTKASFVEQNLFFEDKISQIDQSSIRFGFGLAGYYTQKTTLSIDYDLEKKPSYQSHLFMVKINQVF